MLGSCGFPEGREKNGTLWMTGKSEKEERKFLLLGTVVEPLLSHGAAGAESGWSAGECWLQVKLPFPVRIVWAFLLQRDSCSVLSVDRPVREGRSHTSAFTAVLPESFPYYRMQQLGPFSTRAAEEKEVPDQMLQWC